MFEYIQGKVKESNPAYIVIEQGGIGYFINVSVFTFSDIKEKEEVCLFIHHVIKEDSHSLFGFLSKEERELFRLLISVSGIGANTARMIQSSLSATDLKLAIQSENVLTLKGIKGIGAKTAQRIILDLKDKITKVEKQSEIFVGTDNTFRDEALSALVMLGFSKSEVNKALNKLLDKDPSLSVESLVKQALRML